MDFLNVKSPRFFCYPKLVNLFEIVKNGSSPVNKWCLDYPSTLHGSKTVDSGSIVQGWVLLHESLPSTMQIKCNWNVNFDVYHSINVDRPDVISTMLAEKVDVSQQLKCGFRFTIPHGVTKFEMRLCFQEKSWPLTTVEIPQQTLPDQALLKVIQGKDGWLFLDNDTNNSADQFTGVLKLTSHNLHQWQCYLDEMSALVKKHCKFSAMLMAPAKESVLGGKYHPKKEGENPITQIMNLNNPAKILYPLPTLKLFGDDSFIKTDTHWTNKGAMLSSIELANKLGIKKEKVIKIFKNDIYKKRNMAGDLGSKLSPKKSCQVELLSSFNYSNKIIYDNGLPNIGRVIAVNNPDALLDDTCLTFGSSSSYSMFNYLTRIFKNYVFIHTAGNIDPELVAAISPSYLVTQNNARFIINAPSANYSLTAAIEEKIDRLTENDCEKTIKKRVVCDEETLEKLHISHLNAVFNKSFLARQKNIKQ